MKISTDYYKALHSGLAPSFCTNILQGLARKILFSALKEKIGFKNTRLCGCGAAPISKDILSFFAAIDVPIYEVFGQSESCGPATLNLPGMTKIGTVGKVMPGAELKIASDGEILLKGPHIFSGYYKDEAATNETLKDGWLYSGDVGAIDAEGYLSITDRKKDILITAGGKNISPQNLESMLKHLPYVQSAVVVGDSRKYICALLSPDLAAISRRAKKLGIKNANVMDLLNHKEIHKEIEDELAKINNKLAPVEQIKKYTLLENEFSIDTGEFTPTLKVKRKFVNKKYENEIEQLYK
jgi:long-subunit acyl-CoA synthetase (AMP-forming)